MLCELYSLEVGEIVGLERREFFNPIVLFVNEIVTSGMVFAV